MNSILVSIFPVISSVAVVIFADNPPSPVSSPSRGEEWMRDSWPNRLCGYWLSCLSWRIASAAISLVGLSSSTF